MAPTCGGASSYAQSCAYGNRFNHVTLAHAFALDLTLGVGRFYRVLSRDSGDGGDQRHGSMIGFDLIEAEQHAGMQSLLDGTKVAFIFLPRGMVEPSGAIRSSASLALKCLPCSSFLVSSLSWSRMRKVVLSGMVRETAAVFPARYAISGMLINRAERPD